MPPFVVIFILMISIIIPTLNEEKTIENTLKSLQKLRDYDYEVIVSDGKSKDKTIELAKKYGARVIVYEGTSRQTIGGGRNLGASVAFGDFLVFLDADVIIPDINAFFTKAINMFTKDKSLTGFAPFVNYIPEEATFADKFFGMMMNVLYLVSNNFLHIGQAAGEFQMMRTAVFKKMGGYNEKLPVGEDTELFSRLASIGKTKINKNLHVFQATRRVHTLGWPKLLWSWFYNFISNKLRKRPVDSEWKPIR